MRVALITSWHERCGIAEYAHNLVKHCVGVEFTIVARPWDLQEIARATFAADVVHLNHEGGLYAGALGNIVSVIINSRKRSVITLHSTHAGVNAHSLTSVFSAVVTHERTQDAGFVVIPEGIPVVDVSGITVRDVAGEAGFPMSHKGFWTTAKAAQVCGLGMLAVMPRSRHADADGMANALFEANTIGVEAVLDYLPEDAVARRLAECRVVCFPYHGAPGGISGAVRMGLAARRPLVITECRQFRDLLEGYRDEVFVAASTSVGDVAEKVREAMNDSARVPSRMVEDMSWHRCGKMYADLYGRL
ncbi:MAG: hypothetical protein KGL39_28990 [Patescibacteria group bacterium]|nr:hypothetical protein [Patescibacteria group bacterium]